MLITEKLIRADYLQVEFKSAEQYSMFAKLNKYTIWGTNDELLVARFAGEVHAAAVFVYLQQLRRKSEQKAAVRDAQHVSVPGGDLLEPVVAER